MGGVSIRQPKRPHMKRLLGLMLVMGVVGCGVGAAVNTVNASKTVGRGGLTNEINSETPFTGVVVKKYASGQKAEKATFKDAERRGTHVVV